MTEPPRRRTVRIELVTGAIFVALMAVAATTYPPFRDALDDARTTIGSLIPSSSWTGYYLETGGEGEQPQLMFTSGSFPGRAARVIDPPFFPGRWSPSGERFAFTSGDRLLIADRGGAVRPLGALPPLVPAGPAVWAHEDELVITMTRTGSEGWWLVRLDARSGAVLDQRALAPHLVIESISPNGRLALAWDGRAAADPARSPLLLYDLSAAREIAAPAGTSFVGWMLDGRVLVQVRQGGGWWLEAQELEAGSGEVLVELRGPVVVPVRANGSWMAFIEPQGDEPDAPRAIWLLTAGADPVRVADGLGAVSRAIPARDGRYVSFTEEAPLPDGTVFRTAIIEVARGAARYACDAGCAGLELR